MLKVVHQRLAPAAFHLGMNRGEVFPILFVAIRYIEHDEAAIVKINRNGPIFVRAGEDTNVVRDRNYIDVLLLDEEGGVGDHRL